MALVNLIRKRGAGGFATAIPAISATEGPSTQPRDLGAEAIVTAISAISATQPNGEAVTVARIATVAVANPTQGQATPQAKAGAGDQVTAPLWRIVRYPDGASVVVACGPEVTNAELVGWYPGAVSADSADSAETQLPSGNDAAEVLRNSADSAAVALPDRRVRVVHCHDCANFRADADNPEAAMGACLADGTCNSVVPYTGRLGLCAWPHADRYCALWVAGGAA